MSLIIAYFLLSVSAYLDIRYRKVPNVLTFPSICIGLFLCGFPFSKESYIRIAWCVLLFLLGSFRLMGMGDLKLCMAVLALRGMTEMTCMLAGGIILIFLYVSAVRNREIRRVMMQIYRKLIYRIPISSKSEETYPFALFLCLSYMCMRFFI